MHLVIIIPAYNESKVISEVLRALPRNLEGINSITSVVVDDNSSDDTQEVARACGAICIRHEANLGAGGATITGLEVAKKLGADITVTMDADGQHDPSDLQTLVQPIINGTAEAVLGSRFIHPTKAMPLFKHVGNNMLNIVTYAFYWVWMSDSQSGYRAFSKRALEQIEPVTTGYEFCSEVCGQIKQKNLRFVEVPIRTIYTDYSKSKGQLALNAVNIVIGLLLSKLR